jgi:uncharacterized protein involved in exopolysaccharide biosynthesis
VAIFTISKLDERINALRDQIAALESDYTQQKSALATQLARLRAVRQEITPEMEALLARLNAALGS